MNFGESDVESNWKNSAMMEDLAKTVAKDLETMAEDEEEDPWSNDLMSFLEREPEV